MTGPDSNPVGWTLIIPVKRFTVGKSRLRGGADSPSDAHAALARAIALDTIAAAAASPRVERIVVVTDEDLTDHLPSGAVVVPEGATVGPNPAVLEGVTRLGAASARAALVGDLPALRPADLDEALALAEGIDRTVTPDAAGTGSTLVTARAGVAWRSAFGDGSFARHLALGCVPLPIDASSTLRRDVDTPEDLADAARLGLGAWTRALRELPPRGAAPRRPSPTRPTTPRIHRLRASPPSSARRSRWIRAKSVVSRCGPTHGDRRVRACGASR